VAINHHTVDQSALLSLLNKEDVSGNLKLLANLYPGTITFSTSFSSEDQVISHIVFSEKIPIEVFTLDTGRLFPETYSTWSRTVEKYGQPITAYYPDATALTDFISSRGPNSFYESVENRQQCCHIRKVAPLQKALQGMQVWVTGIRSAHSPGREDMPLIEWDKVNNIIKYHPLLHWDNGSVTDFIQQNQVPYNPLNEKGFVSIGCAPCTRAIQPGEDFRAGRWWWEDNSKKECGLHVHAAETVRLT
jgi:phosphoadenosine phosphosulfate reductase